MSQYHALLYVNIVSKSEYHGSNVLFLGVLSNFVVTGLEKMISERLNKSSMGFGGELVDKSKVDESLLELVTPSDLKAYGLGSEFLGRIPLIGVTSKLTEDDLVHIITVPRNSLQRQYTELFKMEEVYIHTPMYTPTVFLLL